MKPCYFSKASAAAVCSLPTEAGTAGPHPTAPVPTQHGASTAIPAPTPHNPRHLRGSWGLEHAVPSCPRPQLSGLCHSSRTPSGRRGVSAAHVLPPQTPTCHGERARKCKQREARNVIWPSPVKNPSYVSACLGGLCLSF